MEWEVVKIQNTTQGSGRWGGKATPLASIGHARLGLNLVACDLIPNFADCKYVELLRGRLRNNICIGVRFLPESERSVNSLPIRRRVRNGTLSGGIEIHGKKVLEELFGPAASASKTTKYNVAKDDQADDILIIFAE